MNTDKYLRYFKHIKHKTSHLQKFMQCEHKLATNHYFHKPDLTHNFKEHLILS